MLNQKTQAILSELSAISPAAVLKYPITGIQDASKSMIAFVDFSEFDEAEFEDFGIFNMQELLSVINIVEDAEVEMDDSIITIKNDNMEVKYVTTNIDLLESTYSANPKVRENIKKATEVVTFDITTGTLDKLKKTSSLMKLEHLKIQSDGDEVLMNIGSFTSGKGDSNNSFKMKVADADVNEDCEVILKMDYLRNLPTSAYTVQVRKNPKTGSYITMFSSKDIPSLDIVILVVSD